jgi:hypothetical protein
VQLAHHLAQPGDAVLLSPACASFDMFRNYLHRAEVFVAAVRELAAEVTTQPSGEATDQSTNLQAGKSMVIPNPLPARERGQTRAQGDLSMLYTLRAPKTTAELDFSLLWLALALLAIGLVMVYSASIATAEAARYTGHNGQFYLSARRYSSASGSPSAWPPSRCRCASGSRLRPISSSPACCCWWWC